MYQILSWCLNILPEWVPYAFGTIAAFWVKDAFRDPLFFWGVLVGYTFIFHSQYLREKKILERAGLVMTAFLIAAILFSGLYSFISRGQKSKLDVKMKRATVERVMDASGLPIVSRV